MDFRLKLAAAAIGLACKALALATPAYHFQDLAVSGYASSTAFDVNNEGAVIGQIYAGSIPSQPQFGVVWQGQATTVLQAIDPARSGSVSQPARINNQGWIAGYSVATITPAPGFTQGATHASLWAPTGAVQDLGTVGGRTSFAWGLNDAGVVVGDSEALFASGVRHATVWAAGKAIDLGTLGGRASSARAVNASGLVVGYADTSAGTQHATLWTQASRTGAIAATDLGTPGGGLNSAANGVNDAGVIVGSSTTAGEAGRKAFQWQGGVATELVGLGGTNSSALDINASGQVVGRSLLADGVTFHAVLWQNGLAIDLNDLLSSGDKAQGWELVVARGINDNGWIAGEAHNTLSGVTHGFLLSVSAVPEPGSVALLGAGLMTCLLITARRRKSWV